MHEKVAEDDATAVLDGRRRCADTHACDPELYCASSSAAAFSCRPGSMGESTCFCLHPSRHNTKQVLLGPCTRHRQARTEALGVIRTPERGVRLPQRLQMLNVGKHGVRSRCYSRLDNRAWGRARNENFSTRISHSWADFSRFFPNSEEMPRKKTPVTGMVSACTLPWLLFFWVLSMQCQ